MNWRRITHRVAVLVAVAFVATVAGAGARTTTASRRLRTTRPTSTRGRGSSSEMEPTSSRTVSAASSRHETRPRTHAGCPSPVASRVARRRVSASNPLGAPRQPSSSTGGGGVKRSSLRVQRTSTLLDVTLPAARLESPLAAVGRPGQLAVGRSRTGDVRPRHRDYSRRHVDGRLVPATLLRPQGRAPIDCTAKSAGSKPRGHATTALAYSAVGRTAGYRVGVPPGA